LAAALLARQAALLARQAALLARQAVQPAALARQAPRERRMTLAAHRTETIEARLVKGECQAVRVAPATAVAAVNCSLTTVSPPRNAPAPKPAC
jgi:hypothetical protein